MPNTPFLRQKLAPSVRFALICKNSGVTLNQLLHFKGQFHYQVGILMLIATLILSAIILVAANRAAYQGRLGFLFPFVGVLFGILPFFTGLIFFTPVFLTFMLLLIGFAIWSSAKGRPKVYLMYSLGAFVVVFALCLWSGRGYIHEMAILREKYPIIRLEGTLPVPSKENHPESLPEKSNLALVKLENRLAEAEQRQWMMRNMLQKLHESTINDFIENPGFGVVRMPRPSEYLDRAFIRDSQIREPLEQPVPGSLVSLIPEIDQQDPEGMHGILENHWGNVFQFGDPKRNGLIRPGREVVGGLPHQFNEKPEMPKPWKLLRVELVGLLLKEEPVVYMSAHLPDMKELRSVPTRKLESFESSALEKLRKGEDLVTGTSSDGMRILGALRSAQQCQKCHGGERGDLLGAFSYSLSKAGR